LFQKYDKENTGFMQKRFFFPYIQDLVDAINNYDEADEEPA